MIYEKIANTGGMSYEQWLSTRTQGIGGSDAGAILNVNKYRTPLDVYLDKIESREGNGGNVRYPSEYAYWGSTLEDIVAKEFSKRTGKKVRRKQIMMRSKEHPFMIANIDRAIDGENSILECKTASEYIKGEWDDDQIPASYLVQCQHYMAVTGAEKAYIAVLIGGNKFIYKEIPRDEELIDIIVRAEYDFWNENVLKHQPPAVTQASGKALERLYTDGTEEPESIAEDYNRNIQMIMDLKEQKKNIDETIKELENEFKALIGEKSGVFTSKYLLNWKPVATSRIDTKRLKSEQPEVYNDFLKTTNSRRFTIKEIKE